MKMTSTRLILLILALTFGSCSNEDAVSPTAPTMPDLPPPTPEPEPEPFNPGVMFSWDDTRGLLLFAGTQGSEAQITGLSNDLRAAGWPTVTYNVCSETTDWRGGPWAAGPNAFSRENRNNLEQFLIVTARLGDQVKLNIFCTLRDNHAWMARNYVSYTKLIAGIVKKFDHVSLSIANEAKHPDSWFKEYPSAIRTVRDTIQMAGFSGLIGADDGIGHLDVKRGHLTYQYANLGFIPDFHPPRNPDPDTRLMRRIIEANGLPLVFSETTCYSKWRKPGGLCTDSREQILTYMHRAEREGIVFFFHSTDGLQWPQKPNFDWIPQ